MIFLKEQTQNLEDLDVQDFIEIVRGLQNFKVSKELDGLEFFFGLDEDGTVFVSRASENSEKLYFKNPIPYLASYNGLRAASAAIQKVESTVKEHLSANEYVEAELLFSEDEKNIIVLKEVHSDSDVLKALNSKDVQAKFEVLESIDGKRLDRKTVTQNFKFSLIQESEGKEPSADVQKALDDLQSFLNSKSELPEYTNFDVLTISLTSVKADDRPKVKEVREKISSEVTSKFKLDIQEKLLKSLDGTSSDNDSHEAEGIILRNSSGKKIRLVQKDVFDSVNELNNAIRNELSGTIRSLKDTDSIQTRGGLTGILKARVSSVLGNIELAMPQTAKRIFSDAQGESDSGTLKNLSKMFNTSDFNGTKNKIVAMYSSTIDEVQERRDQFNNMKSDGTSFVLKLKNKKVLKPSAASIKRTLLAFAEVQRNLEQDLSEIQKSSSFEDLILVIYGNVLKNIKQSVKEEVLLETRNYTDRSAYKKHEDAFSLMNAYLASVLGTSIILKENDTRGEKIIRDKAHYRMTKWSADMSPMNFWGLGFWHGTRKDVSKFVDNKVATEIQKITKKIPDTWVRFLHMDFSFNRDVPIDWNDHKRTLKYLVQHSHTNITERLNSLINNTFNYEVLSHDEKVKFLGKLYFFMRQYIPTSPLILRIRAINNKVLGVSKVDSPLVFSAGQEMKLLGEDGEIVVNPVSADAPSVSTNAGGVSSVPSRINGKFNIVRRVRNPNIIQKKFKKPEGMK